jgi:hypothetical protein
MSELACQVLMELLKAAIMLSTSLVSASGDSLNTLIE